jgi:hypothetical protein
MTNKSLTEIEVNITEEIKANVSFLFSKGFYFNKEKSMLEHINAKSKDQDKRDSFC